MEQNDYIQIGEPHRYIEKTMSLCGKKTVYIDSERVIVYV